MRQTHDSDHHQTHLLPAANVRRTVTADSSVSGDQTSSTQSRQSLIPTQGSLSNSSRTGQLQRWQEIANESPQKRPALANTQIAESRSVSQAVFTKNGRGAEIYHLKPVARYVKYRTPELLERFNDIRKDPNDKVDIDKWVTECLHTDRNNIDSWYEASEDFLGKLEGPLTDGEASEARQILGETEEQDASDVKPNEKLVTKISRELNTYAARTLEDMQKSDKPDIDLSSNSNRGRILERAISEIKAKYGLKIDSAEKFWGDDTASKTLSKAELKHSTERWQQAEEADITEASHLAAIWVMSHEPNLAGCITEAKESHPECSRGSIIDAYADALNHLSSFEQTQKDLAQIRLRWGPITYGANIYLEVNNEKMNVKEEWYLFKVLIHEALHSAEHPQFSLFLHHYVTPGLRSIVKEGIVEILTQNIWRDVVAKIATADKRSKPSVLNQKLQATEKSIEELAGPSSRYADEVNTIQSLIESLKNGNKRLEEAYFLGNVDAFLPKFK